MLTYLILFADLALQFTAAWLAVRLTRITGVLTPWSLIVLALVFMAFRRVLTIYERLSTGNSPALIYEVIYLSISTLMLAGVAFLGPLFRQIKDSQEKLQQSEEKYRTIVETAHEGIGVLDAQDRITYVNQRMSEIFGYSATEFLGRPLIDFFADDDKEKMQQNLARRKQGTKEVLIIRFPRKDGSYAWISAAQSPIHNPSGQYLGTIGMVSDITENKQAQESVRVKARQQAAVAELGQVALANSELQPLFDRAAVLVAQNLKVEYSQILELQPGGDALRLRAGAGWRPSLVGTAVVGADLNSLAGYTLATLSPVVVEDLRTETRFNGSPLLREHGVVSSLSVVIAGREQTVGVLGAHTTRRQAFTQDDINFLQAMANVLTGAVERHNFEEALQESAQKLRFLTSQLLLAQEKEREKLSLELHEDLGQTLQVLKMQTNFIKQRLPKDQQDLSQECDDLLLRLSEIINQVRSLSWELRPPLLEDLGLLAALRHLVEDFCKHNDIQQCQTDFDEIDDLFPAAAQINICRIFQEALNNIGEHSRATAVVLTIKKTPDGVSFGLFDNGKGFDINELMSQPQRRSGLGLPAMDERVKLLGGSLRIDSRPDRGTELQFTVPFPESVPKSSL